MQRYIGNGGILLSMFNS